MQHHLTRMSFLALLATSALLAPPPSHAQSTTSLVAFQGRVTLPSGAPPANALYRMRFTLYNAPTSGVSQWTETDFNVLLTDGLFSTRLGAITAFPEELFRGTPDLFLEIAVDLDNNGFGANDVQSPRTPLNAVPVALEAGNAAMLAGVPAGDYVTQDEANSALAAKVDQSTLDTALAEKVSQSDVDAALAAKADQAGVESSQAAQDAVIAMKADAASVQAEFDARDDAISSKADRTELFEWQEVSAPLVIMEANRGYLVNSVSEVTLEFPASEAISLGTVFRVSGIGGGGWRINQFYPGQKVLTQNLRVPSYSNAWTSRESNRQWSCVASSASGSRLIAGVANGQLYTSTDAGVTWTARETSRNWSAVASSSDGTKLVATVKFGRILTSSDSGATWIPRDANRNWVSVASSADGTRLVAAAFGGQIYTSTDSGVTWTARESLRDWASVASSSDGNRLVAVVNGSGQIYTSTNAGVSWTARETNRNWISVASSEDGSRLVAAVNGGSLYTSTNAGVTWTPRDSPRGWISVASSADGAKLVASVNGGGQLYVSTDSGVTWSARESNRDWISVSSSADGNRLVAAHQGGQLYTYSPFIEQSTAGATGGLSGAPGSAIELQYIGNDTFLPLSYAGDLNVF